MSSGRNVAVLVACHERDDFVRWCDTLLYVTGGRILATGEPARVLTSRVAQETYLGVAAS